MSIAPYVFPGQYNVYVANHEASGRMVVDFTRSPNRFALTRYAQFIPVEQMTGYYMNMTVEMAGRILDTDGADVGWPDGGDAPSGLDGTESFVFNQFRTQRYGFATRLGWQSIQQATWDLPEQYARIQAQRAMTFRTVQAVLALQTVGNWTFGNTATTTSIAGGQWSAATTANLYIRKSIDYAMNQITLNTLASVSGEDHVLVVSPNCAKTMAESQEIIDYIKASPDALKQIRGELPGRNVKFGLPERLYGVEVAVEDAVMVTSKKGATRVVAYAKADATPALISRPGGLVGISGAPSFSTLTIFSYTPEEMVVEQMDDRNNKRINVRVIDNFQAVVTANISGYLFQGAM